MTLQVCRDGSHGLGGGGGGGANASVYALQNIHVIGSEANLNWGAIYM